MHTLKGFKNANNENFYVLNRKQFKSALTEKKSACKDTLHLTIPEIGGFPMLAITNYASVYYGLHVTSPRINKAKYFIILHVPCKYTYIKY